MESRKRTDVETLARKMWRCYIAAQAPSERTHYRRWDDLDDDATKQGFRAVARMVLSPKPARAVPKKRRTTKKV